MAENREEAPSNRTFEVLKEEVKAFINQGDESSNRTFEVLKGDSLHLLFALAGASNRTFEVLKAGWWVRLGQNQEDL